MAEPSKISSKEKRILKSFPEAPTIGQTPRFSVWRRNKATLWHYPASNKKYKTPLLLIYSLLNQPYILDLGPGLSMIEAFTNEGFDVYLLDFGIPGYEDKDVTLDYYINNYIETAAQRTLRHSKAKSLSVIGYCLGGTLATIFTAITNTSIKNLILIAPPMDFSSSPLLSNWRKSLVSGEISFDELIDQYGLIPAKLVELSMRMMTSPISYSPYLNLLNRATDERYVDKWLRFQQWVKGHIPFVGATLKQIIHDFLIDNKLIKNKLIIGNRRVNLGNITSSLLVISTSGDQIIPEELIKPIMNKVASKDKTYIRVKGGHVTLAIKGEIPEYLSEWIRERSSNK